MYDDKGVIQGITNASIWDSNFARTRVVLFEKAHGNEQIELWVEAAETHCLGFLLMQIQKKIAQRHGWFDAKVETIRFGIFDTELWHLYLDVRF